MKIRDIIYAIETFAPRALQEDYDNAGLQAGDTAKDCTGVLLSLDVSERTVAEAVERCCNLIISHHPLLFKGVKSISPSTETGRTLFAAINNGIAVYAAHTNLDNARFGVSACMAEKLGLRNVRVLQPQKGRFSKIVVFVPESHAGLVREGLCHAGAGRTGDYDSCSYSMKGIGSFRALDGADPYVGDVGVIHHEPEMRIEAIIPTEKVNVAIGQIYRLHPYEEPAFDIVPLSNADRYAGSGAVGECSPMEASGFLSQLKTVFGTGAIRFSGKKDAIVKRVALCGGSGAEFISDAISNGADIFVTGDLKYHDFTVFASRIMLADIGHYESEQCAKEILYGVIQKKFPNFATYFAETDINPINYI